jgi:group I intron endonuclease
MQTQYETIETNHNDIFNLNDDLHNGQIYLIKNKINGKCYIGQALCFTGLNNAKWGTFGRWKSHLREALKTNQDHCVALNNAIRKYGENNFEVSTLIKCHKDELDEHEIKYVKEYNSIQPNGYNIKAGGYSSKNNESTIEKMKLAHLGTRRQTYVRKNDEDKDLPKYIRSLRLLGNLKSYVVTKFPIGIDKCEYFKDTYFTINKYGTKENALAKAIEFLNKLKEDYIHINNDIFKEKSIIKPVISFSENKENKLIEKLPKYIYPILEDNKINGYYVDGIVNTEGKFYTKRIFNNNTNRWNLDQATKFVNMLNYINEHNVDMTQFLIEELDIMDVSEAFYEKYYLPKYFNIFRKKGEIIGFCINGYPSDKHKGGKYKKEFRMKTMKGLKTFDEAYLDGIQYLFNLKNNYITI